jgi:hypothetical protein
MASPQLAGPALSLASSWPFLMEETRKTLNVARAVGPSTSRKELPPNESIGLANNYGEDQMTQLPPDDANSSCPAKSREKTRASSWRDDPGAPSSRTRSNNPRVLFALFLGFWASKNPWQAMFLGFSVNLTFVHAKLRPRPQSPGPFGGRPGPLFLDSRLPLLVPFLQVEPGMRIPSGLPPNGPDLSRPAFDPTSGPPPPNSGYCVKRRHLHT